MRIGVLRHRISLQEKTQAANAYGEPVEDWTTTKTVWGSVEPLRGNEYLSGRALSQVVDTRIRIRYYPDVSSEWRVTWNGHTYDIESVVNPRQLNKEMELMCTEVI